MRKNSFNTFFIITVFFVVLGCKSKPNNDNNREVRFTGNYSLSPLIDSLFTEFYEDTKYLGGHYIIYFDKQNKYQYRVTMMTLQMGEHLKMKQPLAYFEFRDSISVFLYSGIEDFLVDDKINKVISKRIPLNGENEIAWSYVQTQDTSYVVKKGVKEFPPFMKMTLKPTVFFRPPKIDSID